MARLPPTFNISDRNNLTLELLLELIERLYIDIAEAVNTKPDIVQRLVDGQTTDTFLSQGTVNINTSTNKVEMLTNHNSPTNVTWINLG